MQCAAMNDAPHCVISPKTFPRGKKDPATVPTAAHRSAKTTSPLPVHAIGTLPLTPKRHLWIRLLGTARQTAKRNTRNPKTGRSEQRGQTKKDVRQDETGQRIERRKEDDRTERAKRLNEGNRTTGWSESRGRTKKDVQQDGAGQRKERKTTDVGSKHEWQALLRLPLEYHTMQVRS